MVIKFDLLPLVDMDGILTEDERRRIIKRLHSMLSWVGSIIPERETLDGIEIDLRKTVADFITKEELTAGDLETARLLARAIAEREKDLEKSLISGDITEEDALELLDEARGLLRAIEDLKAMQEKNKAIKAKEKLLTQVDDEKRWKHFLEKIKG